MRHVPLKGSWTVQGGVLPGRNVQPELTKQWFYTLDDYEEDVTATTGETKGPHPEKPPTNFERMREEAAQYWRGLNDPVYHNWARIDFIWY